MTQSIKDINSAIMFGNFSNHELNEIMMAVKYARAQLGHAKRREFGPGDVVQFTNSRTGQLVQGTVERVKIKYVLVKTATGRWNVPANMLEAA